MDHQIHISNEDQTFDTFIKLLYTQGIIPKYNQLQCKKAPTRATRGNKYKKVQLDFFPNTGCHELEFKNEKIIIQIKRGTHVLTSECRLIDYLKDVYIRGPSLEIVKEFVEYVFSKLDKDEDKDEKITIYENNGGYWNISKEKKPRTMESVIFKQEFVNTVIEDISDFIDSEQWYSEMGIPYKRSYLLYGPPGTGKSSFAQAIAGQIKFSICFVNCSDKINDFHFNSLLNRAPQKSIILIEDVDSIFSERKNTEKNNQLTFSGFLNAIDGVRSQEGRIIIMTTNYRQRLDPALLRPGRVDEMYEIKFAESFQIQKLTYRFFKDAQLAKKFASSLPQFKFSMSMIQGFLLRYRKNPQKILDHVNDLLESDENIKMQQFLNEINCKQVLNDFKIQEIFTLAQARSLPKDTLEKMISKLNPLLKGRFMETIRCDRKMYVKSQAQLLAFIEQNYKDEQLQRDLKEYVSGNMDIRTVFVVRDKARELQEK